MNNKHYLVFDCETTGIPDWNISSDDPKQPHIVQLAAGLFDGEGNLKQSMNLIVKPDGWEITPELTAIHGITNEYALKVGFNEKDVLNIFMTLLKDNLRIAHNTTFDNRIIRIALKRFYDVNIADAFKELPYNCTMIESQKVMGGKRPKLEEAYKYFFNEELTNTHSAYDDMIACAKIFFKLKSIKEEVNG